MSENTAAPPSSGSAAPPPAKKAHTAGKGRSRARKPPPILSEAGPMLGVSDEEFAAMAARAAAQLPARPAPGLEKLGDALANAPVVPRADTPDMRAPAGAGGGSRPPPGGGDPGPDPDRDGGPPRLPWLQRILPWPEGCPIVPLGKDGGTFYYLDALRQLRAIKDDKHGDSVLMGLFGRDTQLPVIYWPRQNKDGVVTGWRPELCKRVLMTAAAQRGIWNPFDHRRGRGAWPGREPGQLVYHCGDKIIVSAADGKHVYHDPGLVDGFVYPAAEPIARPDPRACVAGPDGPAAELQSILDTWKFQRDIDSQLLLGWIVSAMVAGALDHRPLIWLTGGSGTGKTTLQDLMKAVLGNTIVKVTDATAAGIWSELQYDTLPVAVDEMESARDNRRNNAMVKLARDAATGGLVLRGSKDHESKKFLARSSFAFSSIFIPPLPPQDRSRLAILNMGELGKDAPPSVTPKELAALGAKLRRRMLDHWGRFEAVLEIYRTELRLVGHTARGQDQFGALLACADIALHDAKPLAAGWEDLLARARDYAAKLNVETLSEVADGERAERSCLNKILQYRADVHRSGAKETLAEWILRAAKPRQRSFDKMSEEDTPDFAKKVLGRFGLRVRWISPTQQVLMVANQHVALAEIFRDTIWETPPESTGIWMQALRRLPGATAVLPKKIGGIAMRSTAIPLEIVLADFQSVEVTQAGAADQRHHMQ